MGEDLGTRLWTRTVVLLSFIVVSIKLYLQRANSPNSIISQYVRSLCRGSQVKLDGTQKKISQNATSNWGRTVIDYVPYMYGSLYWKVIRPDTHHGMVPMYRVQGCHK
jgi:hypothetical protein